MAEGVDAAHRVTDMLRRWAGGDEAAFEEAIPLVYGELYRIARAQGAGVLPRSPRSSHA